MNALLWNVCSMILLSILLSVAESSLCGLHPHLSASLCASSAAGITEPLLDLPPTLKMIRKEALARAAHSELSSLFHIFRSDFRAVCKCCLDCDLAVEDTRVVADR
jgi:hypothetical protein